MLATETTEIAELLKRALQDRFGEDGIEHFSDNSDTLCYATNENQDATRALIEHGADLAIVVGGANSSNTSHLVELCEERMSTYFISGDESLLEKDLIEHFDLTQKKVVQTRDWLPEITPINILLTAGASCPDVLLDRVMQTICSWIEGSRSVDEALEPFLVAQ
jgi:4-hydroxy-3-methylbut-2-enyl diphosphate reductase